MRRFLQRQGSWLAVCMLLLGCVLLGLVTRASYTDMFTDPNLGKAPYWYGTAEPNEVEEPSRKLMENADLIATVEYTGERCYTDKTFLTNVEVHTVYQGNLALAGKSILIYEPVWLSYAQLKNWLGDNVSRDFVRQQFPDLTETNTFINASPMTETMRYHAPMREGQEYLVFLTPKEYPKESPLYQQQEEYNYVESIYALLDLSAQPENFMPAPELISLEEAAEYPVLLMNEAELERYIRNREEIINSVLGDGH